MVFKEERREINCFRGASPTPPVPLGVPRGGGGGSERCHLLDASSNDYEPLRGVLEAEDRRKQTRTKQISSSSRPLSDLMSAALPFAAAAAALTEPNTHHRDQLRAAGSNNWPNLCSRPPVRPSALLTNSNETRGPGWRRFCSSVSSSTEAAAAAS